MKTILCFVVLTIMLMLAGCVDNGNTNTNDVNTGTWLDDYTPVHSVGTGPNNFWIEFPTSSEHNGQSIDHLSWIQDSLDGNCVVFVVHKTGCVGCADQAERVIDIAGENEDMVKFWDLDIPLGGDIEQKAYDSYLYDPDGPPGYIALTGVFTYVEQDGMSSIGGWQEKFLVTDGSVGDEEFMSGAGGDSEDSDIHFHYGHGYMQPGVIDDSWICYKGYAGWNFEDLFPTEVYQKWGDGDNEVMLINSCYILCPYHDHDWGDALDGGHIILGWISQGPADADEMIECFLDELNSGETIKAAWYTATTDHTSGRTAGIIGNNYITLYYDHLWGQGPVTPDEISSDTNEEFESWTT